MSSPVDENGKRDDPSTYAPKRVRDSNREGSHEGPRMPEGARSEQSIPENAPANDQARAHRALDTTFTRTNGLLPQLGADALRLNFLKVTRSPRYAGLARQTLSS
jgi:hypothetical protein